VESTRLTTGLSRVPEMLQAFLCLNCPDLTEAAEITEFPSTTIRNKEKSSL
jgi:hypothetical protein